MSARVRWMIEGWPRMLAEAIDAGIEADFALSLAREWRQPAPDNAPQSWPWRLRIRALGALALYRGEFLAGEPEEPWGLSARERLRRLYVRAWQEAATAATHGAGATDPAARVRSIRANCTLA